MRTHSKMESPRLSMVAAMLPPQIKLAYIDGLKEIVMDELGRHSNFHVIKEGAEDLYLEFIEDLKAVENLRSVLRAYVVLHDQRFNPAYISKHLSILDYLIRLVVQENRNTFRTFKLTCAGGDSKEVRAIAAHIELRYKLREREDADLKLHIVKIEDSWEIGVQLTSRPLSVREYKVRHLEGGINPTLAYAINALCGLDAARSYLNIFSGSATLLIEAGYSNPALRLVGFDTNKKSISAAIQNIKKAGMIRSIQLKHANIFNKPDLGTFDVITSDVPFGMVVSKHEDLEKLYRCFVEYCEGALLPKGTLVVYTSEHELLKNILEQSKFRIITTVPIRLVTAVNAYLYPKIFVCTFR